MKNRKIAFVLSIFFSVSWNIPLMTNSCEYYNNISDTVNNEMKKLKNISLSIYPRLINKKTINEFLLEIKENKNNQIYINEKMLFKYINIPKLNGNVKLIIKDINIQKDLNKKMNNGSEYLKIDFCLKKGSYISDINSFNLIGNFHSSRIQDQIDVDSKSKILDKELTLSVNDEGRNIFASVVTRQNLNQYIKGLPENLVDYSKRQDSKKMNVEIFSIFPSTTNNKTLIIQFVITKNQAKSKIVTKNIYGFKQPLEEDQKHVNDEFNKGFNLTTEEDAKNFIASGITKENIFKYINFPTFQNNVLFNIVGIKSNDNLGKLTLSIQLIKNGAVSKITNKYIYGFRIISDEKMQNINELSNSFELKIKENGKKILPSNINKNNIEQYVTNFPVSLNLKIVSLEADDNLGILTISMNFIKNSIPSENIIKNVVGFKTKFEEEYENVYNTLEKSINLTIKNKKQKQLASKITKNNIHEYIEGFFNSDTTINVNSIEANDELGMLLIKMEIIKNGISHVIIRNISGFKTNDENDKEYIEKEYLNQYNKNELIVNDHGKNVFANSVNKENIKKYIDGFNYDNTKFNLEILHVGTQKQNDNKIDLIYQIVRNKIVSKIIYKEIVGFKNVNDQDFNEVLNQSRILNIKINERGLKTSIHEVNKDNIELFIEKIPEQFNNIEIKFINLKLKEINTKNNSVLLTIEFSKNGISVTSEKQISGFLPLTEEEVFVEEIKDFYLKIKDKGKNISAGSIDNKNLTQYIDLIGFNKYWTNILWNETEFNTNENERTLTIAFTFLKNNKKYKINYIANGFIGNIEEANNNLFILANEYNKIEIKNNLHDLLKNDSDNMLNNLNYLNNFFNLPNNKRNISVSVDTKKIFESNGKTSLLINWILTNRLNNKEIKITKKYSNILDSCFNVKKIHKTTQQMIVTKNEEEQMDPYKFILSGSEQDLFTHKWETHILKEYKSKSNNWKIWSTQWLEWKIKQLIGSNVEYIIEENINLGKTRWLNHKIDEKTNLSVIGCLNKFIVNFKINQNKTIKIELNIEFLLKNGYWN